MSIEVISRFFESAAVGDLETALDCFTEDAQWITPENVVYGKDQIGGVITEMNELRKKMISSGTDAHFDSPLALGENEGVVKWTVRTAEGQVLERGADILTLRDGRIAVKDVLRKA